MLTEEAHHLFVGQTGVGRVIKRTAELIAEGKDPRTEGAIPFEIIQKYIHYWCSSSNDLYGGEVSSNGANFFRSGLKGRAYEERYEDHTALNDSYEITQVENGRLTTEEVPLRNAMNEVLRDEFVKDNLKGIDYWNRICEKAGVEFRFRLPHRRFHRTIGIYANHHFDLDGNLIDAATFESQRQNNLPTDEDRAYVQSLMQKVTDPGKYASWIAPPPKGINGQPIDFEYVRL
jgi:benzoyl-CoA 2,3-dioxygenase component B